MVPLRRAIVHIVPCFISLLFVSGSWASKRKTYSMDINASGVHTITFDVQEGEFVLRGDPSATTVSMRVSIESLLDLSAWRRRNSKTPD